MFKNILAAVDGSAHSFRALDTAASLSKSYGATLSIVSVYRHHSALENTHSLVRPKGDMPNPDQAMHDYTKEIVERACDYVRDTYGLDSEGYVRRGQPARTIVAAANELEVDTIVMGSRGLGDMSGLLLGSVSHKVASMAECTLVTVK
jgi:nucleotide-binding universal stress UspA family protein